MGRRGRFSGPGMSGGRNVLPGFTRERGDRDSAAVMTVSRIVGQDGSISPPKKKTFSSWKMAASYACAGHTRVAIHKGTSIAGVLPRGDGVLVEIWLDGKRIEGDRLREMVEFGVGSVLRRKQWETARIAKLDADLAKISGAGDG